MNIKVIKSGIFLIIIFLISCSSTEQENLISSTETLMALQFTKIANDLSVTQTVLSIELTKAEMGRIATESAKPTNTTVPTETPIPPSSTPTSTSTQTPTDTSTPTLTETLTETPATIIPTFTATPVKGMAKVRIENRTEYDINLTLECIQGVCSHHSPQKYSFVHPPGVWIIHVWDGKYRWKYTYCGDKYNEWVHTITSNWWFYMRARNCKE